MKLKNSIIYKIKLTKNSTKIVQVLVIMISIIVTMGFSNLGSFSRLNVVFISW